MTIVSEEHRVSAATAALIDLAEAQRVNPSTGLTDLARRIRTMHETNPAFRAAVRDADSAYPGGEPELLAVARTGSDLIDASTAFLDALLGASDFLNGEGLAGIPVVEG